MLLANRFKLIERVGVGGSASVYRADDASGDSQVAIKVLHPSLVDAPEAYDRFELEAELIEGLDHPCIPSLIARADESDEIRWFAIEFVEGKTLSRIAAGGIEPLKVVEYGMEVCGTLGYLHGRGIVHRDLKPENVIIDGLGRSRLIDFGVARDAANRRTMHGDLMGTPGFMPPEQALDTRDAGPAADIYSLGVTLFATCTRRSGLELTFSATREAALGELAVPMRAVVRRATEKDPAARYSDATSMEWALAEAMESL